MNSILSKLTALIENNKVYTVDGTLNRNLLAADARKYDAELLNLLQQDKSLKEHFFAATEGGLVFKKDVFLQFVTNKEFLPDSYTKYKIKIGLGTEDGSLLSEGGEVVLNWPYKDTILEGGQDKEDQKRREVFFNEVLAPDQITRLLDDKVFTNWKRYDKAGEHQLDELKDNDNLIIKGNNLVVLHSLKKRYAGKVKMIYIDPPYNTGNDSFGYNDRFNHSSWLTFMKNRITVAKELLSSDGVMLVQCDDNEQPYLQILMNELFGRDNFVNHIIWKRKFGNANESKRLGTAYDSLLLYQKSSSFTLNSVKEKNSAHVQEYISTRFTRKDTAGKHVGKLWMPYPLANPGAPTKNLVYTYKGYSAPAKGWRMVEEKLAALDSDDRIYFPKETTQRLQEKKFLDEYDGQPIDSLWNDIFVINSQSKEAIDFSGQKPEALIQRIILLTTNPGDLVLDYHLGSGTTAATAHKMGRKYIGVEQLYYGESDPTVRLHNVINGDKSGISKSVEWQGGGSFVYCNVMNNANKFRERVEHSTSDSDYIKLFEEAASSSFLSYRVDPKKLNEVEFRNLSAAEKRRLLLELVDNNTLYVNYEDINDPIFKVSEEDKKFNDALYRTKITEGRD